jgi:hypothetical protein
MRKGLLALGAALGCTLLLPGAALAHGLVGRTDLPIPEWLFGWAAAIVLVVSFVALAVLWPEPKLEGHQGRRLFPIPGAIVVDIVCGAIGVVTLGVVVWAGFEGEQTPSGNFASIFVFVTFWIGLAFVSVLLGDIFKAFNPWRAIGRGVAGLAKMIRGGELPAPLPYPERLGRWPAAVGIFCFAFQELAASDGNLPEHVAIATLVYSALTFVAMALYGVDRWIERGEAFSVYFNLFSRISPFERRDDEIWVRKPLSALTRLEQLPGTVPLLAVMIGSVSFDGAAEGEPWVNIAPDMSNFFQDHLGMSPDGALAVTYTIGLLLAVLIVYGFYTLGIAGARTVGGGFSQRKLANAFVHSIVPIAFVYVAAHYFTLLLFEGQRIWPALSDPDGSGFENWGVDYTLIGANATWYWQVGFVITGHVAALTLAHDRALVLYREAKDAVRSQYWMLAIMVGFTSLALWLLSQANQ